MTEDQIIAYVDGELGPIDALRFERAMEADPALAASVAAHRAVRDRLAGHFAPVGEEALPDRLTSLLDRGDTVVAFPAKRRWFGREGRYAALAATLVAGLALGVMVPREAGQEGVVAKGGLTRALDVQLASAPADGPWRIGVSFRSRDQRYCRTFEGPAGAGIGCRNADGWAVERFVAGDGTIPNGGYRQASSGSAEIAAAAQEMISGEPLDAAQEQAARKRGWR